MGTCGRGRRPTGVKPARSLFLGACLVSILGAGCSLNGRALIYDRYYEVSWPDGSEGAARWVCMRDPYQPKEAVLICTDIIEDAKGPVTEL